MASGSDDQKIRLGNASTRKPMQQLEGHTSGVHTVTFTPDGKTLVSGGRDKMVRLWDVPTGQAVGVPLTGHTAAVLALHISPDSEVMDSVGLEPTLVPWPALFWRRHFSALRARLCEAVGRDMMPRERRKFLPPDVEYRPSCPKDLLQ